MIKRSEDGIVEVLVSDTTDSEGYFTVSSKHLKQDNVWVYITVFFGGKDNQTRIEYKTQDEIKRHWLVKGRDGDIVTDVRISTTLVPQA